MLLVSVLSSIAIAFGIGANLPQIARMHRSRSAAGQSPLGWIMGAITNLCLAYVNLVGLGATLLGFANLGTVVLCSIAVALTLRFGGAAEAPPTAAAPTVVTVTPGHETMIDMPTQEFVLLREAIDAAEERRTAWRAQQQQHAVVGELDPAHAAVTLFA